MPFEHISFEIKDSVAKMTLNRPECLNAVSIKMVEEMDAAIDLIEESKGEARCLLLTGAGRGFSSGADLAPTELLQLPGKNRRYDAGLTLERYYNPLIERLNTLNIPIVTAVNGPAAGAGMSFALVGDIVLASENAYFLQAFVNLGLVPDAASSYFLPRLVGNAHARAMMMLGEKIPAETALEWGLIYKVFPDAELMQEADAMATKLANGPTQALGLIRRLANDSADQDLSTQLQQERAYQRIASRTNDFQEGVAAFLQKRQAKFTGK